MSYDVFNGKRVLITGGAGFIGSHLARTLVEYGAEVTIVDSMIPEYGGNLRNIEAFRDQVRFNIADVRDQHALVYLTQEQDYLFNLAGQTSHMDSMTDPQTDLEINARAQLAILETCRAHNPSVRIVFASTRQLYGRPQYLPVDEAHPVSPVDVNGVNKHAGEAFHLLYHQVYDIPVTVLRLTNTYGPAMRVKDARQTFVGIWVRNAVSGEPFEVWGGEQLRDFNYVDDVVDAFLRAATDENAIGRIFNLGASEVVSLKQLAEMIAELWSCDFTIRQFPDERRRIDIGDYYSDYSLIADQLGWQPQVSLRDGLARTLSYYSHELSHYL